MMGSVTVTERYGRSKKGRDSKPMVGVVKKGVCCTSRLRTRKFDIFLRQKIIKDMHTKFV